jgi:hypothetical protein
MKPGELPKFGKQAGKSFMTCYHQMMDSEIRPYDGRYDTHVQCGECCLGRRCSALGVYE